MDLVLLLLDTLYDACSSFFFVSLLASLVNGAVFLSLKYSPTAAISSFFFLSSWQSNRQHHSVGSSAVDRLGPLLPGTLVIGELILALLGLY